MWFPLASQIWAGVAGGGQRALCVVGSLQSSTCHLAQLASSPPPQLLPQISPQLQLPCLFPISWQPQQVASGPITLPDMRQAGRDLGSASLCFFAMSQVLTVQGRDSQTLVGQGMWQQS
jgi:hypothetical protein